MPVYGCRVVDGNGVPVERWDANTNEHGYVDLSTSMIPSENGVYHSVMSVNGHAIAIERFDNEKQARVFHKMMARSIHKTSDRPRFEPPRVLH